MYFSEEALADLRNELATVPGKEAALRERYLHHAFRDVRAKEFAHHGFVRRLSTLARCIENVFTFIPPERSDPVDRQMRRDAEINIQASIFNVFAAADNLAWIWVIEKTIRQPNGSELPASWIGLRRDNRAVRDSLPDELKRKLESYDDWFDIVDNYRHALAHRIPLYIPPYCIDPQHEAAYKQLGKRKDAARAQGDLAEYRQLGAEQRAMEFFRPLMLHSIGEKVPSLVFHPQLLANFNTIEELGREILEALDDAN